MGKDFLLNFNHKKRNIKEHLAFKFLCFFIPIIALIVIIIFFIVFSFMHLSFKYDVINQILSILISFIISFLVWGFVEYKTLIFDIKMKVIEERDKVHILMIEAQVAEEKKIEKVFYQFEKLAFDFKYYCVTTEFESIVNIFLNNKNTKKKYENTINEILSIMEANEKSMNMKCWVCDIKSSVSNYKKLGDFEKFTFYFANNNQCK